jgi:thioredoxin reductase
MAGTPTPDAVRPGEQVRHDVVIVGGGPAGLSAALVLGRSRRDVLVVDAGSPRNAAAGHVHGYLGRDGTPPDELLAIAREEVERYGVRVRTGRATALLPAVEPGWIAVSVESDVKEPADVLARRVLVATGLEDRLPDIPEVVQRWGRDVMHCPYCHGWEVSDEQVAVLATTPEEVDKAVTMHQWSADVVLVLHGLERVALDTRTLLRLEACGIRVVEGPVVGLAVDSDRLTGVRLADGTVLGCSVVVVHTVVVARDSLLVQVGAEVASGRFGEFVVTDETGATGVPGVWAAGNVTDPQAQVVIAAAAGYRAALAIDHDLIAEDADASVQRLAARTPSADGHLRA